MTVSSNSGKSLWLVQPLDPDSEEPDWKVAVRVAVRDGRLVVAELRIFPATNTETGLANANDRRSAHALLDSDLSEKVPHGGLTTRSLRQPFLERALDTLRAAFNDLDSQSGGAIFGPHALAGGHGITRELLAPKPPRRGRQRSGVHERRLAEIARLYTLAVEEGSKRPNADVAAWLGDPWTANAVRDYIHDARRHGILDPAPRGARSSRGLPGGRLTDKGHTLLDDTRAQRRAGHQTDQDFMETIALAEIVRAHRNPVALDPAFLQRLSDALASR